eukprot:scaffold95138_cov17-Tisochrysis_lutea.AAC.2
MFLYFDNFGVQHVPDAYTSRSPWAPGACRIGSTEGRTKSGRFGQALKGHLRAHCFSWPTPWVVSIKFDAVILCGCHAHNGMELQGCSSLRATYNFCAAPVAAHTCMCRLPTWLAY